MKRILMHMLLPGLLLSCASPDRKPAAKNLEEEEALNIAAFQKQYAAHAVPGGAIFPFDRGEIGKFKKTQTLRKAGGMKLELQLGKRWLESGDFRTNSRYHLLNDKGRLLAAAESTLSLSDLEDGDNDNLLRSFYDPAAQALLVYEEMCWCVGRHILFERRAASDEWVVRYVYLPARASMNPTIRSTCIGIQDAKVYFELDGRTYAIPFGELREEQDLRFSLG